MRLDDETWGDRLRRARERQLRPGGRQLTMSKAAEWVSEFWDTSAMALTRLEKETTLPKDPKRRLCAYLAITAYGFDPADWGLSVEELPRWVDRDRLLQVIEGWDSSGPSASTRWTTEVADQEAA